MIKEIADAFGIQADSLEGITDHERPDQPVHCESCDAWAKRYAELEAVVTARKEFSRITAPGEANMGENQDFCV